MYQAPIFSLSPELVLYICDKLQLIDLKQLRLSCRAIGRIADSLVLRNLRISVETSSMDDAISYLQSFARSPAHDITQEILIEDLSSLSPSEDDGSDSVDHSSIPRNKGAVKELLVGMLASLRAVQRVTWRPNKRDSLWLQETIWSSIQLFSALRHLHIDTTLLQFSPTFEAFTTLESISIDAGALSTPPWLYTSLSKLYASCPTLTSLAIRDTLYGDLTKANSLDQIFLGCSKDVPPNRLRRLSLHDCFVHINKFTLPHLRQLTSLELHCEENLSEDQDSYIHPRDIWSSFIGSGIRLEELVHNTTTTPMMKYLSTYSGLKKLKLFVSPYYMTGSSSDKAAAEFFSNVLPRHLETLESLSLEAYYESKWCFTLQNAALITQCTKLNSLLISINPYFQAEEDQDSSPEFSKKNMIKYLLDTTINLPLMSHLSVRAAFPEFSRGARCGTSMMRCYQATEGKIITNVKNYQPPPSCQYIPKVEVAGKTFEGVRQAANGQLRYVEVVSDLKKTPMDTFMSLLEI